jgi:glyoxylate/hydroxypyruvate reductase
MSRASVLIQVGLGEHLVKADFIATLDNGQLSTVTLNVYNSEPFGSDHPYWDDPRIMVSPHDASEASVSNVVQQVAACVSDLRQGRVPKFAIDRGSEY